MLEKLAVGPVPLSDVPDGRFFLEASSSPEDVTNFMISVGWGDIPSDLKGNGDDNEEGSLLFKVSRIEPVTGEATWIIVEGIEFDIPESELVLAMPPIEHIPNGAHVVAEAGSGDFVLIGRMNHEGFLSLGPRRGRGRSRRGMRRNGRR